jgi:hypothetical protein
MTDSIQFNVWRPIMTRSSTICAALGGTLAVLVVAAPSMARAIEIKTPQVTMPHVNVPQVKTPQAITHVNTPQLNTHVITSGRNANNKNTGKTTGLQKQINRTVGGAKIEPTGNATLTTVGGAKIEPTANATLTTVGLPSSGAVGLVTATEVGGGKAAGAGQSSSPTSQEGPVQSLSLGLSPKQGADLLNGVSEGGTTNTALGIGQTINASGPSNTAPSSPPTNTPHVPVDIRLDTKIH